MAGKLGELRGALAQGAERFERVILSVKARQLAETRNAPVLKPASDGAGFSPDEMWSKNYMTVGIGPAARRTAPMPDGSVAFRLPEHNPNATKLHPALARSPANTRRQTTIGDALAKPVRRRSLLARLLLGA